MELRQNRGGRWYLQVVERKDYPIPVLDPQAPRVGVDVGLNCVAATSTGRLYGQSLKPRFDRLYQKVQSIRANRQRQGLRENSPRLDRLEDRLSGLTKTACGHVANRLIQDHPGHTFVIEDLDLRGCRGSKRFCYRGLHRALASKAPCLEVNPAYTSQTCPSCGYVHRSNRRGTKFKCRSCGRVSHADLVGGLNLLRRSEDQQIQLTDYPARIRTLLEARYRANRSSAPRGDPALGASNQELTRGGPVGASTALNAMGNRDE
jgi:putative transposase